MRGLVRLQGVIRGQNVKRQTMNAMKQMQLLVRVQTQIQSRRIQTLENQTLERQTYKNEKEVENSIGKWTFSNLVRFHDFLFTFLKSSNVKFIKFGDCVL